MNFVIELSEMLIPFLVTIHTHILVYNNEHHEHKNKNKVVDFLFNKRWELFSLSVAIFSLHTIKLFIKMQSNVCELAYLITIGILSPIVVNNNNKIDPKKIDLSIFTILTLTAYTTSVTLRHSLENQTFNISTIWCILNYLLIIAYIYYYKKMRVDYYKIDVSSDLEKNLKTIKLVPKEHVQWQHLAQTILNEIINTGAYKSRAAKILKDWEKVVTEDRKGEYDKLKDKIEKF